MARKELENLPVSGKGFERFFTTSTILHIVAVLGVYFFITTSIRVIKEYQEWAQAKQEKEEKQKRDESQAEETLSFSVEEIIRERLEDPTEEQLEKIKEKVLEKLKDKKETEEILDEIVEEIEELRKDEPGEDKEEEDEDESPPLQGDQPGEDKPLDPEDMKDDRPQEGAPEENEPAELPDLEPEELEAARKDEKDIKPQDLPKDYFDKLTDLVDDLLPEAVKTARKKRKEDELVKKVIYEDLPEIENKLDNALKRKDLEEHLKDALKELAREVAKNTYDELKELNKELIKEFRKTKEKEKKDELRQMNKEVIALNKERSKAVKEIQKALNDKDALKKKGGPEGAGGEKKPAALQKAKKLAQVAKKTHANIDKLKPLKESMGKRLDKHKKKAESLERLAEEVAKTDPEFFAEKKPALMKALEEKAKEMAIEQAAEQLAEFDPVMEEDLASLDQGQEKAKAKAKESFKKKVEEELEKLEEELEALEQEAKEADLAMLDSGEEDETGSEGNKAEGKSQLSGKTPPTIELPAMPGEETKDGKLTEDAGEGEEKGGGVDVPGIKAAGISEVPGGTEEEGEGEGEKKESAKEASEGNEKGGGLELPGFGEKGGVSETPGEATGEEGEGEEEQKPKEVGEGNEKGGGVELPGTGELGGQSLTPGASTGEDGANESGKPPPPKEAGDGNEKGSGVELPGTGEVGGQSLAAGEEQGGEGGSEAEEGETPGEGGEGAGGETFAEGEGAGEGQGAGGAGNVKGTQGNAETYSPESAAAGSEEEEVDEEERRIEQQTAAIKENFPQLLEALAEQTQIASMPRDALPSEKEGGGGASDADSDSTITLKSDELGKPVLLFQSPGTLGVTKDVRREIVERNLWLRLPDEPPALPFAKPTTIGKLNRKKLPKPAAEVFVGDVKKREIQELDPNRGRLRHPNYPKGTYAAVPFLLQPPKIDGDPSDWSQYPTITHLGKLDNGQTRSLYMGWRPEGLYVLAKVRDKVPGWKPNVHRKLFWRFDCIEFWFDMKNSKAIDTRKEDCQQFFVWPALNAIRDKPELNEVIWAADNSKEGDPDWIPEGEVRMQDDGKRQLIGSTEDADGKGYTLEIYLPRALLRNLHYFKAGQVLGFHYIINHGFMTKEQQYDGNMIEPFIQPYEHMKFHYSSHPNSWGNLQLLGTDGYVNILRPDGKVNEYPIVEVSKALGIQVLDPDSDQDAGTRDHVTIRVRNRYGFNGKKKDSQGRALGDWEDVLLTETETSSGIFEGWIPTTILPSRNNDQKLGVQIGDKIDVFYNDYVKSAGEYDKRINAEVEVVSPVYIVKGGKKRK